MPNDPFNDPNRRVARAKTQLEEFNKGARAFWDGQPCGRAVEPDADGFLIHKVKFREGLPEILEDIAFEMIGNLRSALDLTGACCARLGGVAEPKAAYFPIAPDETELKNVLARGRCKQLPPEILALFLSFNPYKAGNHPIWALNEICNGGKHRLLVPAAIAVPQTGMKLRGSADFLEVLPAIWDRAKNEIPILRVGPKSKFEYEMEMTIHIALERPPELQEMPVDRALFAMFDTVREIISATEAKCKELGLT